eukprot:2481827-Amphidinium_carterae.2
MEQHGMNLFEPVGQHGVASMFDMTQAHDLIGATPRLTDAMPPPPPIGGQHVPHTPEDLQQQPPRYMGIDTTRRDYPDFSAVLLHLTSSSQHHDQQVDVQRIVQRHQRFDITQQEHVTSRYHEEYRSAVEPTEAEVNLQAQQQFNFVEFESRAYFDARCSALRQEAQIEFAAARIAQLESVASATHLTEARTKPPETVEQVRALSLRVENLQAECDILSNQSQSRSLDIDRLMRELVERKTRPRSLPQVPNCYGNT